MEPLRLWCIGNRGNVIMSYFLITLTFRPAPGKSACVPHLRQLFFKKHVETPQKNLCLILFRTFFNRFLTSGFFERSNPFFRSLKLKWLNMWNAARKRCLYMLQMKNNKAGCWVLRTSVNSHAWTVKGLVRRTWGMYVESDRWQSVGLWLAFKFQSVLLTVHLVAKLLEQHAMIEWYAIYKP